MEKDDAKTSLEGKNSMSMQLYQTGQRKGPQG